MNEDRFFAEVVFGHFPPVFTLTEIWREREISFRGQVNSSSALLSIETVVNGTCLLKNNQITHNVKKKPEFSKWKSVQIEMDIVAPNNRHPF